MIKPLFTEKSLAEAQKGRFTFRVEKGLSKYQIKKLIEDIFKVNVIDVATMNYKAYTRRTIKGTKVSTPSFKKAIISLKAGEKIDLFVQEKPKEKKKKTNAK